MCSQLKKFHVDGHIVPFLLSRENCIGIGGAGGLQKSDPALSLIRLPYVPSPLYFFRPRKVGLSFFAGGRGFIQVKLYNI